MQEDYFLPLRDIPTGGLPWMSVNKKVLLLLSVFSSALGLFITLGFLFIKYPDFPSKLLSFKEGLAKIAPRPYVVYSGSMEPAIKTASVIVSVPQKNYYQGDVITFSPSGNSKDLVTHRIALKQFPEGVDGTPTYLTAGDANEDFDNWEITNEKIIGKVAFSIPYVGYIADFAKKPQGFILLVVVPATIVIYEELKMLKGEIAKFFSGLTRKIFKKKSLVNLLPKKENRGLPKAAALAPVFGALMVILAFSAAYFIDIEDSIGNIFDAGVWGPSVTVTPTPSPTPTPGVAQTLVVNEVMPDTTCSQGNIEAQWIELYNGYTSAINPKNFKITDGTNTVDLVTANNLSIPSGGFLLLSHNSAIWNDNTGCWDDHGVQTGNLGGTLNIDVGQLQLIGTDGVTVIDTVIWGSNSLTPSQNESIERNPDGWDSAFGTNFAEGDFVERTTPQPGL